MTDDTDYMGQLQTSAHTLRSLAEIGQTVQAPLEEITENLRSIRIIAEATGGLLRVVGEQLSAAMQSGDALASRVKNPADAAYGLSAALAVARHAHGGMTSVAGGLHAAETALNRIERAPDPEEHADD